MGADNWRRLAGALGLMLGLIVRVAGANAPPAGFTSFDPRLPNLDRPYEMTSGTVNFNAPPFFGLYDLEFEPSDRSQLDVPSWNPAGTIEFDSEFDIAYRAWVSFGLGPVYPVSGIGRAHMVGKAPAGGIFEPQVFQTELLALSLGGLSPIPEVYFRESPTLRSTGVTIREDICPPCAGPLTHWRIASFFDVHGEFSYDGGHTWTPGERPFRIEQAPGPGLAGDYNLDGRVNGADYVVVREGLEGGTYSQLDLLWWRANFGNRGQFVDGISAASVPEPESLALIFLGGLICRGRRRKRSG